MGNMKIYEMPGCISCRLKFSLGKALPFEAFFDGGVPDKRVPATYMTSSIGKQLAIENSEMFNVGKIRIAKAKKTSIRVVANGKPSVEAAPIEESTPVEESTKPKEFPEVTTLVEAIGVLKGEYRVSASRLKTEASVLRVADEKNVSFPNLK